MKSNLVNMFQQYARTKQPGYSMKSVNINQPANNLNHNNMELEILKQCTVEGNVVKLPPGQLERKLYEQVAKHLHNIGGNWNRKAGGFVFSFDPSGLLNQQANGDGRNIKKEFQAYFTTKELGREIAANALIDGLVKTVLEPSAGTGQLVGAILKEYPFLKQIDCCELNQQYREELVRENRAYIIEEDFMRLDLSKYSNYYDRVIANPPFNKNQDISHIQRMYEVCKPGGRIVSVASLHWEIASGKKESEFRGWLYELDYTKTDIDAGAFKESGTMIKSCYITINKQS